jgi:hypothetical protein
MLNTLEYYQKMLDADNLVIAYNGDANTGLLNNILTLAENKLEKVEYSSRLKKKVFNILVEVLQNIHHNFDELETTDKSYYKMAFLLVKSQMGYQIFSGNFMLSKNVDALKNRIERINGLSDVELRENYRQKLNEGEVSPSGRAGLGIIDIVRKSGEKLEYGFTKKDDAYSYFSLKVNINKK